MLRRLVAKAASFYARRALRDAGAAHVSIPSEAELAYAALRADDLAFAAQVSADAGDWSEVLERTREARAVSRHARALRRPWT